MIGSEILHYKVIAPLGTGGMGEVYVAEDTKLRRRIALKVLPSKMADDPERLARFRREAVAVAALNHPNIVTIYSVEESGGVHFLTMELVEGKPLSELIDDGGMSVSDLLDIALPLSRALAAAHAKGITHRDLKPQNVMIANDGAVKILDFGLAKIAVASVGHDLDSAVATDARTKEGVIVGTIPYMSPEQARGAKVDARSDIFSFGVMLYELASGRRPFRGGSAVELVSSILKDDPPRVDGLPNGLNDVVQRCLAKAPDARYQTGRELSEALSVASVSGADVPRRADSSDIPWIVVRSFKTRAGDDELTEFAEGLTEDIVAGLALFSHLSVTAEGSERRGQERFALEGTLRKSGTKVRANVKLIDCVTGAHLWAEQFHRDLATGDVFAAQDELTDRIVATVADPSGVLTRSLIALVKKKPAKELSAHECVLRTFGYLQHWRRDEHAELREAIERAVEREPDNASGWACLAGIYLDEHRYHYNPRPDALNRALTAAQRAVELDATNSLTYRALAEAHYFRCEIGAFRAAADRVLMLNPRDTSAIAMIGLLMGLGGDWEGAKSIGAKAMAMNPHPAGWYHCLFFWDYYRRREYAKALEVAEKINMPRYTWTHGHLAVTHAQLGNREAAQKHAEEFLKISPRYAKIARIDLSKWFRSEELVEHILEGLAKAGLDINASDEP